ncbi:MAG: FAD:protein FMN transferase, partial [Acidobacteriota bacterium]
MITRRELLRMAGGAALLNVLPVAAHAAQVRVHSGPAFGSAWRLVLADTNEAAQARSRLEAVVARIDALMSPFRADSEVARFNTSGFSAVSLETGFVTRAALEMARDSDGAFDPTLAPLGRRYGFGPIAISPARPAGRHRELRIAGNDLATACPGLSLDLCGIAKGYAVDEIVRALNGLDFLVELGGEVAARGRHPSGRPWRAGIERPDTDVLQRTVAMDGRALATSGDAAQSYVVGGRRYAHVLDPHSRTPVENGVASVSVLAATGMIADGLATAAMVLGP